jgi:hypothetical protein
MGVLFLLRYTTKNVVIVAKKYANIALGKF